MPEVWLRPQLLKSLVIVIRAHVMKVYASTLIIYKVDIFKVNIFTFTYYLFSVKKYDKVIQRIHLFWWRIPKVFINYAWTVFLKKQQVMRHPFFCFDRCEMKNLHLLLLFFVGDSCLLSLCILVWNKFSLRRRTFHCTFDFLNFCTVK